MSGARALPTLRSRMARHVLLPLAAVWLAGTAMVAAVVSSYTGSAFDRALLDDALGLAASVALHEGRLRVDLSPAELGAVLFAPAEQVHFVVRDASGARVAGEAVLADAADRAQSFTRQPARATEFADIEFGGETLRAVSLQRPGPPRFTVLLAQTTRGHAAHLRQVLLASVAPLIVALLLLAWWLRRTIDSDLRPLCEVQTELNRREAAELQPLAVPAATQDVEQLLRSVNGLMGRLRALIADQREFSGNVAHELRTPLAGIRALAEHGLAQDNPALWREQLAAIVQSQERASRLVDQLLALALADEARIAPTLVPLALGELVRRVLLSTLPRADSLSVDLGAQGIDDEVLVMGDAGLIEGALQNLLDNALRYGRPADGSAAHVTVEVERDAAEGQVTLAISDNGPGLDLAQQANLLERWQQGEPGRQLGEGAGLGLAIVARYAQLLGAPLTVAPGPGGQGARVSLRLKRAFASTPPAA